jgi:hypothetical protein
LSFLLSEESDKFYQQSTKSIDSDLFLFGILMFEIWCSFGSIGEGISILSNLTEKLIFPPSWKKAFPIQAKVILMLINRDNKPPSALDLLQTKLIPTLKIELNDRIQQLSKIIRDDTFSFSKHAPAVINAFFAESRKSVFGWSAFKETPKIPFGYAKVLNSFNALMFEKETIYIPCPILNEPSELNIRMIDHKGNCIALPVNPSRFLARYLDFF